MTAAIIDGKAVAREVVARATALSGAFVKSVGRPPGLAVVLVGEDPASQVYVRNKSREADACGFRSEQHSLPADTTQADLLALVGRLNADPGIDGILVQLPLPRDIDPGAVLTAIDPAKDVDGFHPVNVGLIASGETERALVPCTPAGVMILIGGVVGRSLAGRHAVVLGRSNIVGKPLSASPWPSFCSSMTRPSRSLIRARATCPSSAGRPMCSWQLSGARTWCVATG